MDHTVGAQLVIPVVPCILITDLIFGYVANPVPFRRTYLKVFYYPKLDFVKLSGSFTKRTLNDFITVCKQAQVMMSL